MYLISLISLSFLIKVLYYTLQASHPYQGILRISVQVALWFWSSCSILSITSVCPYISESPTMCNTEFQRGTTGTLFSQGKFHVILTSKAIKDYYIFQCQDWTSGLYKTLNGKDKLVLKLWNSIVKSKELKVYDRFQASIRVKESNRNFLLS